MCSFSCVPTGTGKILGTCSKSIIPNTTSKTCQTMQLDSNNPIKKNKYISIFFPQFYPNCMIVVGRLFTFTLKKLKC